MNDRLRSSEAPLDERLLRERLRADLDRLASRAPLPNPHQPPLNRQPLHTEHPGRSRRLIGAVLAAAALVVTVLVVTHTGTTHGQVVTTNQPPGPSSTPSTSPTSTAATSKTTLPDLLPGRIATLQSIHEEIATGPPVTTGATYAQDFDGPAGPATARLLITTEDAPESALASYAETFDYQAVTVAGQAGYLLTLSTHLQLLWQDPSGIVVSLEAINISPADLTSIAALLKVRTATDLGVRVTGPLPDGLTPVRPDPTGDDVNTTQPERQPRRPSRRRRRRHHRRKRPVDDGQQSTRADHPLGCR
jgi:hypothetical protein